MAVKSPYFRTFRPYIDGDYTSSGGARYVQHPKYATSPHIYTKAFSIIIKDLMELFEYVQPSQQNAHCYSHRSTILLTRACIEVEANLRAILDANGYCKNQRLNMHDYFKINKSHRLSSYQVRLPEWDGQDSVRTPFEAWTGTEYKPLDWYAAYNGSKHDRVSNFNEASLDNVINAICGLCVVLSAQFGADDFGPGESFLILSTPGDFEVGSDGYFWVKYPSDWPEEDRYDFDVETILESDNPFQKYPYQT